jgi:hypothetical protein
MYTSVTSCVKSWICGQCNVFSHIQNNPPPSLKHIGIEEMLCGGGESYDTGSSPVRSRGAIGAHSQAIEMKETSIATSVSVSASKRRVPLRKLMERELREKLNELIADPSAGCLVIANMTFSTFQRFLQEQEDIEDDQPGILSECRLRYAPEDFGMWKRFQNKEITSNEVFGDLIVVELVQSEVHKRCKDFFSNWISSQYNLASHYNSSKEVRMVISGFEVRVDGGAYPNHHTANNQVFESGFGLFPNVIWQVAYKHETEDELAYELLDCLSDATSIQVAIGVKIDDQRTRMPGFVKMIAMVYRRNQVRNLAPDFQMTPNGLSLVYDAEQVVEFGTNIAAGIRANSAISFPLQDLFFGSAVIPNEIQALIASNTQIVFLLSHLHNLVMELI